MLLIILGLIGLMVLLDWLSYKYIPGNTYRDGEIKIGKYINIYGGPHNLAFHFDSGYYEECNDQIMTLVISTMWHGVFIHIPWWKAPIRGWSEYRFGFYLYNDNPRKLFTDVMLMWGKHSKYLYTPWSLDIYRTTIEGKTGRYTSIQKYDFKIRTKLARKYNSLPLPLKETYEVSTPECGFCWEAPYTYILRNGEVQNTTAWYHIEEREWRRRWLRWCPLFNYVRRTLDIDLKDEIGEQVGTWKGGVTGFGKDMLPGEDPHTAYQRIMKETKHE